MNKPKYRPGGIPSKPFIPRPSLHIGMLRDDPWNEFLEHRPVTADELLHFASIREQENQEARDQIAAHLTVIAGVGPPLPLPPLVEVPSLGLPDVSSFLFQAPSASIETPEAVVAVPGTAPAAIVSEDDKEETKEAPKSFWDRMQETLESIRNVSQVSLPSWFDNEQALVIPRDPAIRAVLGSIYGGVKTRVLITVRVIEALDVPVMDFWGTTDPYVTVCLVRGVGGLSAGRLELLPTIGAAKSSSIKFASLNPKWNESVALDPADLLSVISDSVLHISMWDKDVVKSDDPIGFTTVSLIDALEASGVSPYPILPIQVTGSLIGPHAGLFVKLQLRMVQKVGVLSVTPIAVQGFTRNWKNYSIRLEVKVTASDPIASQFYMTEGLAQPESTPPAVINDTGHAMWPQGSTQPVTILFSAPKKAKPYVHITLKTDAVGGDAGQIAIRLGMLERLGGVGTMKLSPLEGSPESSVLGKCSLYCGVECELVN